MSGRKRAGLGVASVGVAVLSARSAPAEYWSSSASDLLHGATRVEIVRVSAVTPRPALVVERSLRGGRAPGTADALSLGWFFGWTPSVGQRLLLVCDRSECPRALGVEHNGAWALHAQEPGDGASVLPPLVEDASLPALMAGTPAPALCVRATPRFVQAPGASGSFDARVDAGTGQGTASGGVLGASRTAGFGIPFGSHDGSEFSISVTSGRSSQVTFNGSLTGRAPDGCLLADVRVERPVARTPAELTLRLGGTSADALIAQGTLRPVPGVAGLSGPTPVSISSRGASDLRLRMGARTGSGVEETVAVVQFQGGSTIVGFQHGGNSTYPALLVEIPRAASPSHGSATDEILQALPPGASARWQVFYTEQGRARIPAGTIELTGVAP